MESLAVKVQPTPRPGSQDDQAFLRERLRYLLDYEDAFDDASDLFDDTETDGLVRAISGIRVLDPAVGSGAFPMGVLHKLALALGRLDPHNVRWRELQKELAGQRATAAFDTRDQQERDAELAEISDTFERYRDDFGRKLYLIQNSIFGVDIQPVACQIAKLRFFISLAIEQEPDTSTENFGIKPLPNLETRFVAANTLLGLDKPAQLSLGQTDTVSTLQKQLNENRERHFHATTRREKLRRRGRDKTLRSKLAKALREADFPASDAEKLGRWDPYDQNESAEWFDPEYMFGITDGFDLVIGNPPYIQLQRDGGKLADLYKDAGYETFVRTGDIYQLFQEKGCRLLRPLAGLMAYITANVWLKSEYGKLTRRYLGKRHTPLRLLEMGKDVFENTIVDTSILLLREGSGAEGIVAAVDMDKVSSPVLPPDEKLWGQIAMSQEGDGPWSILSAAGQGAMDKVRERGTLLKDWDVSINLGIKTGCNDAFVVDEATRQSLISTDPKSADIIRPMLNNRHIQRYWTEWTGDWLIATHNGYGDVSAVTVEDYPAVKSHLDKFCVQLHARYDKGRTPYNLRNCTYHEDFSKEKLLWTEISNRGRFTYSETELYCNNSGFILTGTSIKYLCGVLNSTLIAWLTRNIASTTGLGLTRWQAFVVESIPIPILSADEQSPFIRLIDTIVTTRVSDPQADTSEQEAEMDRLVYGLYGLTEAEMAAVEGE